MAMPKGTITTPEQRATMQALFNDGVPIQDIAAKMGVGRETVIRQTVRDDTRRDRILAEVVAHPGTDTLSIAQEVNANTAAVDAMVISLNRLGMLTYRHGKKNGHHTLVDIKPTAKALKEAGPAKVVQLVGHSTHSPSLRPGDMSDFRNHPFVAEGGEVTRRRVQEATPAPEAAPAPKTQPGVTKAPFEGFPLVSALSSRKRSARLAADILKAGGMQDLADMVTDEGGKTTPFEEEVLRLWSLAVASGLIEQPVD